MRLLNVEKFLNGESLPFEVFWGGNQPEYAILSHTWFEKEAEELRYQDIEKGTRKETAGYRKIRDCCRKANQHGCGYVWADTCCIDKQNSVELAEAISSMFSWYKGAKICFAYLADYDVRCGVPLDTEKKEEEEEVVEEEVFNKEAFKAEEFKGSKWFKRGWTLQELIAPESLVFYSHDWKYILSKSDRDMCGLISEITGIGTEVLAGEQDALKSSSVAQRMSWASGRETKRPEDIAYCLLGIFDVHMHLSYGEGSKKAFIRLQKNIMEESDDHSLFAWRQNQGPSTPSTHGPLASSPASFADSSSVVQIPYYQSAYWMSNRGLEIQLYSTCTLDGKDHMVILGCADCEEHQQAEIEKHPIGIYVALTDDNRLVRTQLDQLVKTQPPRSDYKKQTLETLYFLQEGPSKKPTEKIYNFRVVKPGLPGGWRVLGGVLMPSLRGRRFISQSKAMSVGFFATGSTCPGQRATPLEFDLERGGRAGVLFRPSKGYIGNIRTVIGAGPEISKILKFIAVIFGVNLDGSVYGDIVGIMKEEFDKIPKKGSQEIKPSEAKITSLRSNEARTIGSTLRCVENLTRQSQDITAAEPAMTVAEEESRKSQEIVTIEPVLDGADTTFNPPLEIETSMPTEISAENASQNSNEATTLVSPAWFEKYIQDYSTSSSTKKFEREIWDLIFSVDIQGGGENAVQEVNISYRSK